MRVWVRDLASSAASVRAAVCRGAAVLVVAAMSMGGLAQPARADTPAPVVQYINGATYTNLDSLQFTIYFSQMVVNVDAGDFEVSGTTAGVTSIIPAGSGGFLVTVSGGDLADLNGEVRLGIADSNDIQNLLGTPLGPFDPGVSDPTVVNNTPPNCAFSTTEPAPVSGEFVVDITCLPQDGFADYIATYSFSSSDLNVTNASIESFSVPLNGAPGSVTLRPQASGEITVNLPANSLFDEASNPNTESTEFSIQAEAGEPEISFSSTASSPVNAPYTLIINFSEDVTGFSASAIGAAGAFVSDFTALSASSYSVLITPAGNGTHFVGVAANAATDSDGYGNLAPEAFEMTYDGSAPTVSFSSAASSSYALNATFDLNLQFSETVSGFEASDLVVVGGSVQSVNTGTNTATATILTTQAGTLTVNMAADQVQDAAGNGNTAASQFSLEIDGTAPVVSDVDRTSPSASPAQADAVTWNVIFSEAVSNVSADDFELTGSSLGIASATALSTSVYRLTTDTGLLQDATGTVTLALSGTSNIVDAAGNRLTSLVPARLDERSVVLDNAGPVLLSIERSDPTGYYTNGIQVEWLLTFDEPVSNVAASDFDVFGTTASASANVQGNEVRVSVSGGDFSTLNNAGVRLEISRTNGITDALGNALSSTSPSGTWEASYGVDHTSPVLQSIRRYDPTDQTTNADSLTWIVSINEPVQDVTPAHFGVSGTTATVTSVTGGGFGDANDKDDSSLSAGRTPPGYIVTVSGGDLADLGLDAPERVELFVDPSSEVIRDLHGNALASSSPTGEHEFYDVQNGGPQIASITRSTPGDETTNADSVTWSVQFSRISPAFSMAPEDFTLTGTTADLTVERFSIGFNVTASGGDLASLDGEIALTVSNAALTDEIGNTLVSTTPSGANDNTFVLDNTAPTASLAYEGSEPESGAFSVDVTFSETVTGFTIDDLALNGATASNLQGAGASYTVDVTPTGSGTVSIVLAAGAAADVAGNESLAASSLEVDVDVDAPTVTLSSSVSGPVAGAFDVGVDFSEAVAGLTLGGFSVTNGAATNLTGSGAAYSVTITPASDGDVTVLLLADAASDAAGNGNETSTELTRSADFTAPTPVLASSTAGPVSAAFPITIAFDEAVTGFTVADLSVTNGSISNFAGSGTDYTATITPSDDGTVTVSLDAGAAEDAAGNASVAASDLVREADLTAPAVALTTAAGGPVSGAFRVNAAFDSDVTGFGLDDLVISNGTASDLSGSGADYSFLVTPADDGPVTIELPGGAAEDSAGNASTAAEALSVDADLTAPSVLLSTSLEGAAVDAFILTVTFSEDVTGFALDDLDITNGEASGLSGSGSVYTLTVTPTGGNPLTIALAAGAALDGAGNFSLAAETFEVETDAVPPVLTLGLPSVDVEGPFEAIFDFSEPVTGFSIEDVGVSNGDVSAFTSVSASQFTATITPRTLGTVGISIAEGAASDEAGNPSEPANGEVEAVAPPVEVNLTVGDDVADVTQIVTTASISNPGSEAIEFRVDVDVDWLDVTPRSGTIAGLDTLDLVIAVNDQAEALAAGSYTGRITVVNLGAAPAGQRGVLGAEGESIVVSIPLTITIAERRGTIQLVATTPGGLQRDESFTYVSGDPDLDGLSLTTSGGLASSAPVRKLFGTYDITQALPQGWRLDSLECSGDLDGGSVIDVAAGRVDIDLDPEEDIVCTFANTRDEAEIRLATQRAIRNFMVRRADRILDASPDLSRRFTDRDTTSPGHVAADITRNSRLASLSTSLSGLRNHAKQGRPQVPDTQNTDTATDWDVWLSANYSAVSDDRAGDLSESTFGIVQMGADWQASEGRLFGIMLQRDWMDDVSEDIAARAGGIRGARVSGSGWMAGPYLVQQVRDGIWLDAMALYGTSNNTVDPLGLYEDEFETERFMLRVNLTGEWRHQGWRVRPSASLAHFEETQTSYTDSLGIVIPEQTVSVGRFEAGPEVAYRFDRGTDSWWEPMVGLTGVWDYNPATLLDENGGLVGTGDVRADARLGVQGEFWGGAILRFTADVSGLGTGDFDAHSARLEIRIGLQ